MHSTYCFSPRPRPRVAPSPARRARGAVDAGQLFVLYLSPERFRHRERGRYPAVRVDHMLVHPVDDALDGVADVLRRRDDDAAGEEQHRREDVVEAEDRAVRGDVLRLEVGGEAPQELEHPAAGVEDGKTAAKSRKCLWDDGACARAHPQPITRVPRVERIPRVAPEAAEKSKCGRAAITATATARKGARRPYFHITDGENSVLCSQSATDRAECCPHGFVPSAVAPPCAGLLVMSARLLLPAIA